MRWDSTALAIMCVPCQRSGGYFVPTDQLVLASLDAERPHPVHALASRLRSTWADRLFHTGAVRVVVAMDDLAVTRSWMLPPTTPTIDDLWPQLHDSLNRLMEGTRIPVRFVRWSHLVDPFDYDQQVELISQACSRNDAEPHWRHLHEVMGEEVARRLRFERSTGRGDTPVVMRRRAADQVANYAVQGQLVHQWGVAAYLHWTAEETDLMGTLEPAFATHMVAGPGYGESAPASVWERFPPRFADLIEELRLYAGDLPQTPGTVRPKVATAVLEGLADLLTPGTCELARRRLRSLDAVLGGGPINRARVRRLLEELRDLELEPGWAVEQVVKKLFCQLTSRYTDAQNRDELDRHRHLVADLAHALDPQISDQVALALTGSMTGAPEGIWHPYFSDIDIMPLFATTPSPELLARARQAYTAPHRPSWVHLNEGAREGVAGLTRDPANGMFVADQLHTLTAVEAGKLGRLVAPMRHVGGSAAVFEAFTRAHEERTHVA
ncbi:hypothetical protein [Nocardiopsis ganjiahuensis]|uniref:hypothetical protein n=1 Tax=Nocardiopsis ganjiahuensis TaxID=239984 RepID=UPI00034A3E67|nr:hypothetical protein [Nocardiopsis ganjiahuensis]